jgi:hypothetical protein
MHGSDKPLKEPNMRALTGFLVAMLLATSTAQASDATKQQALEAASLYLALAGSCATIVGQPDVLKAAIADSITTLAAGGYASDEATALTTKMVAAGATAKPLQMTPAECTAQIKSITDSREKLKADLTQAQ